jgi:hypothetical protein
MLLEQGPQGKYIGVFRELAYLYLQQDELQTIGESGEVGFILIFA